MRSNNGDGDKYLVGNTQNEIWDDRVRRTGPQPINPICSRLLFVCAAHGASCVADGIIHRVFVEQLVYVYSDSRFLGVSV